MLDAIIRFSVQRKPIIGLLLLALLGWGSYAVTQLPIDAVPDITNNQVQVITQAPAFSALDIERLVTFPVEQSMANLPHLIEMRSFSRFGLSVITLVFDESIDVYWARQQVSERLSQVKNQLPAYMGEPELAPITTGLGEIFQYCIRVKPGYESQYTITQLRTIQDWLIRRQLIGTPGVADVSSFGGYLKQYEVSVNAERLRSYGLSLAQVYEAVRQSNQNSGGAYIEKTPHVYFIRTEGMVADIADMEQIWIKNLDNGTPLVLKDVAEVEIGHAVRYGAMTYNEEGETVGGIVLMLKGENSSKVIAHVKNKIQDIAHTLPEGIYIEPYLDRSKLVSGAIRTVATNLIEGALIVLFVLVLFLGNIRAGLIVASVIPLAMLFAVGMMHVFGVSGNLMSLGAIDFGIIIDGAVIIVEATLHHLHTRKQSLYTQSEMDGEVIGSATAIRKSAVFGELIILVVYLPLLTLVGIEGKMFKPMAQTVSFAIAGAFMLSLTYVPMMSALFLQKKISSHISVSDRLIHFIYARYKPLLAHVLSHARKYMLFTLCLLIGSVWVFTQLGSEFLPTLDEGDFAIETRLLPGSSIAQTTHVSMKSAQILRSSFSEVDRVIGKIGTSEIPMDPMPMEACDLIVVLKPKDEWINASTREELAKQMQHKLEQYVPGVSFGFQQPIQMRFNELMTGARQDVVMKIYGENLQLLARYAEQIGAELTRIEGAEDVFIEPISGIGQIVIKPDRAKLAMYGIRVADVNEGVYTAMAGNKAGFVFELEKQFDLVLRYDSLSRTDIEHINQIPIINTKGMQIPLSQVAEVAVELTPNQIQRDAGKRRVIVGFNVRGRDLASVVADVQARMKYMRMEPGYLITYGGTFQNLEEAKGRLMIAVPVALALIFMLLYFTFHSLSLALLIYAAIPLSAIGGIMALWIRGMPFSISAGVGFIALFGVSVLNGIVLVAEFIKLRKQSFTLSEVIHQATQTRLRPVLITALVASLGFLPMAISNGDGAEVQKPLATVVIGGLLTSTLLTLFIIPLIYNLMSNRMKSTSISCVVGGILMGISLHAHAQSVSMEQAERIALANNNKLKSSERNMEARRKEQTSYSTVPKTDVSLLYGQYNSFERSDNNFTIAQSIPLSTLTGSNRAYGSALYVQSKLELQQTKQQLIRDVKWTYLYINYLQVLTREIRQQDSLFAQVVLSAQKRLNTGDMKPIEYAAVLAQQTEVKSMVWHYQAQLQAAYQQLQHLLQTATPIRIADSNIFTLPEPQLPDTFDVSSHPIVRTGRQQIEVFERQHKSARSQLLPDVRVGYFNQTLIGYHNVTGSEVYYGPNARFQGMQIGLAIPFWFVPGQARVQTASVDKQKSEFAYKQLQSEYASRYESAKLQYKEYKQVLAYFKQVSLTVSESMQAQAAHSYTSGDISYTEFLLLSQRALQLRMQYVQAIWNYNQSVIELTYLINYE